MTTFCVTLCTDQDLSAIWMMDQDNRPIDLASLNGQVPVSLPSSSSSSDDLLQIVAFSPVAVFRKDDRLNWSSVSVWGRNETIVLEVGLVENPRVSYALLLERNDSDRASTTISKLDKIQVDPATDPARSSPKGGEDPIKAASFSRLRDAFFETVEQLRAAHIELSRRSLATLAALARRGHTRATVLLEHVDTEGLLAPEISVEGRGRVLGPAERVVAEIEVADLGRTRVRDMGKRK